jgi:3'-phosphoadenosine 5'-phosphosulfate sulfotransferase
MGRNLVRVEGVGEGDDRFHFLGWVAGLSGGKSSESESEKLFRLRRGHSLHELFLLGNGESENLRDNRGGDLGEGVDVFHALYNARAPLTLKIIRTQSQR